VLHLAGGRGACGCMCVGACACMCGHYPPPELILGGTTKTSLHTRHSMATPLKEPPELRGLLEACWKGWHAVCGWLCFALVPAPNRKQHVMSFLWGAV
jgi:hypothetical protein